MPRIKPYTTNQESWSKILQKNICIPMSQRTYSWKTEEVTKFIDDIITIFEEGKYVEKMGSIINFKHSDDELNDIYDGQQRLLTTVLILIVISWSYPKLKEKIDALLTIDTELDGLTPQQTEIKEYYNVEKLPKIYCVDPNDMKALIHIFNNDNITLSNFIGNIESFGEYEDCEEYICSECGNKSTSKKTFTNHVIKLHDYSQPDGSSELYNALNNIDMYLSIKKYNKQTLINLYNFMLNDIDIQYFECKDSEYVTRIFDWENNRGMKVEFLDIIKNNLLIKIPPDKRQIVYNRWEELKRKVNKIYTNFGVKLFNLAIQLYNNHIDRKPNPDKLFKSIINDDDTYKELNKFFKIVEKLFQIMDKISDDRFGRLVNNTSSNCLCWDAYMFCLLPIFYKTNNIDKKLIKLMTKWYFRNLQFKNRSFNNISYSDEFIKITNLVLENKDYDYYKDIENCLVKNKDESIIEQNYIRSIKTMEFKQTKNATHLLLFLETCINTDLHITPLDLTLEHIYPMNDKEKLTNHTLINNIGNLTLLEGKNSDNNHKGNSSLGKKTYDKKKLSYQGSCSKITREIPLKFNCFTEEAINERNKQIVKLLNRYTNY